MYSCEFLLCSCFYFQERWKWKTNISVGLSDCQTIGLWDQTNELSDYSYAPKKFIESDQILYTIKNHWVMLKTVYHKKWDFSWRWNSASLQMDEICSFMVTKKEEEIKGHKSYGSPASTSIYMSCRSHCYWSMLSVPSINVIIWYKSAKIICNLIWNRTYVISHFCKHCIYFYRSFW